MKKTILPEELKILFDQVEWVTQSHALFHSPQLISLAAHLLEDVSDDLFFVGKVKIEVAGADV